MKFVMLVYQGTTPLPGSDRWKALPEAEQRAIYAGYAELNKAEGMTGGAQVSEFYELGLGEVLTVSAIQGIVWKLNPGEAPPA